MNFLLQQVERAVLRRAGLRLGLRFGLADAERFQRSPRRAGDVWIETDGLAKVGDGVLAVVLHAVGDATVVVGKGKTRVEADGFAVVGNGGIKIAVFAIRIATRVESAVVRPV